MKYIFIPFAFLIVACSHSLGVGCGYEMDISKNPQQAAVQGVEAGQDAVSK